MNMYHFNAMIPLELKTKPNWVGHKKKIPINFQTGYVASSNNEATWGSFSEGLNQLGRMNLDGLGFMFEPPYVGLDLDDSIVSGKLTPFAQQIVDKLDSYTEYSPSKTGIHIICKGILPGAIKTHKEKNGILYDFLEVYQNGRFFTMTGDRISRHSLIRQIDDFSFLYPNGRPMARKPLEERVANMKEGDRNNTLFSLAARLRDKGETPQMMYQILLPMAREVELGEKELALLCNSAGRYEPSVNMPVTTSSLKAFMSTKKPPVFVVDELITDNTISIIAGLKNSKKSWLLLDLAVSIASGTKFLDRFACLKKKVLIVDQERPELEMQRRLDVIMAAKGLMLDDLEITLAPLVKTKFKMNIDDSYRTLCETIENLKPQVLLIDSLKAFQTGDIRDNYIMQHVFERFKDLRNNYNLSIVILHHENKLAYQREEEGKDVTMETITGASAIVEVPENIFITIRHSDETSILHQVANNYGRLHAPLLFKVEDLNIDKSKTRVYTI